jgi:hypothetical protein
MGDMQFSEPSDHGYVSISQLGEMNLLAPNIGAMKDAICLVLFGSSPTKIMGPIIEELAVAMGCLMPWARLGTMKGAADDDMHSLSSWKTFIRHQRHDGPASSIVTSWLQHTLRSPIPYGAIGCRFVLAETRNANPDLHNPQ